MTRLIAALVWLVIAVNAWLLWVNFGSRSWHLAAAIATTYAALWGLFFALSKLTRRKKLQRLLATTMMGLILLGMFESVALLNLLDYREVLGGLAHPNRRPWDNPNNDLDEELLHIHRGNTTHRGRVLGNIARYFQLPDAQYYDFDVAYDERGFRNEQTLKQANIIVVGDSFVEGALVGNDEIMTTQLESEISHSVCNLGQSAYGPQQELEVVTRFGLPLKPEYCIWLFYEGNDLIDAAQYDDKLKQWQEFMVQRDRFWNRSLTRNVLTTLPRVFATKEPRKELWKQVAEVNDETVYFMHTAREHTATDRIGFKKTVESIAKAAHLCKEAEVQLVFAFAPSKFRVYQPICKIPSESVCGNWQLNDLPDRFRKRLARTTYSVEFLDLTSPLRDAAKAGSNVYFADDTHWNPHGHQVVAKAITARLKKMAEAKENRKP